MKVDDLVLALAPSLLGVEPAKWEGTLAALEEKLGPGWSLRRLEVPNTFSLGARLPDGREVPLTEWREALGGPVESRVLDLGRHGPPGLPDHIAAAFANSGGLALAVHARGETTLYALETLFSRQSLITPRRFMDFVRLQPHAERVLAALSEVITESNQLNDRPAVAPAQVEAFLLSREGAAFLDLQGSELLRAVQSTVRGQRASVVIPEDFRRFFTTHDPDEWRRSMMPPERRHELVPAEEELQLETEATARDFAALVEAQPFAKEIWGRIAANLNQFRSEDAPPYTAASMEEMIRTAEPEAFRQLPSGNLMGELQMCCKGHGVEPRIPEALKGKVSRRGPTPEDLEKDPSLIPEREQLRLEGNTERYQVYLFAAQPGAVPPAAPEGANAREHFISLLRETEAFAERMESPYAEAFKLARFVLETGAWRLRDFTPGTVDSMRQALDSAGFSERAREVFTDKVFLTPIFQTFSSSEDRLRGLLAYSIGDVFGGMGSWNDQGFDSEELQARYEQLSGQLFAALRAFFLATVNAR